jgi:hypothetical protein
MNRRTKVPAGVLLLALLTHPGPISAGGPPDAAPSGAKQLRFPEWGVELTIPGYKTWDDYPSNNFRSNFLFAAQTVGACRLNLSMFVENEREGASAEECVRGPHRYQGNPDLLSGRKDVRAIEHQATPLTFTRFDQVFDDPKDRLTGAFVRAHGAFVQNQLYGYWTRGRYCFELHISSVSCPSFPEQAVPILRSVTIGPDTGATLETVELARTMGGRPGDWRLHTIVAKRYSEEKSWHAAVPFYRYALAAGAESIPPPDRVDLLFGLGDALVRPEESRREGIDLLRKALEEADQLGDTARARSALFALAWSVALSDDRDGSCARARELLSPLGKKERNNFVREIRENWPCHALHQSDCYRALLEELGLKWRQGPWKRGPTSQPGASPAVR